MSVIKETKEEILSLLKTLPVCIPNSMETQFSVRCPYCGDSKDLSHGHLSIHIDKDSDDAMLWRCFKCDESGIVNSSLLQDLGLFIDTDLKAKLRESSRSSSKMNKFLNQQIEKLEIPNYNSQIAIDNLTYINNRLGSTFNFEDAKKYNMILDLIHFIKFNMLTGIPGVSQKMLIFLQYNYVGFLTANKNTIVLRCRNNIPTAKRYLKYKLNPSNPNPMGFYNIPEDINILSTDPLSVHVSEGIFDILGIKRFHEENKCYTDEKNLYFASCGFGPMTVIQYLVYMGMGGNIHLHVYCDNDKSDSDENFVLRRKREMLPWCSEIWYHRNGFPKEKDYGIPIERIIDQKRIVKLF